MNIIKKDWYCYQCTLQFDSSRIFVLHLKLVHKQKTQIKSIKQESKSTELPTGKSKVVAKSDSKEKVAPVDHSKKNFKCEICNYTTSHKRHYNKHIASVHERKKPFQCDFCNYTCSENGSLKKHVVCS